jgi:hypothetical protein
VAAGGVAGWGLRAVSRTVVLVPVVRVVVAVLWAAQPDNSKPASRAVAATEQVANGRAERVIEASPWAIESGGR